MNDYLAADADDAYITDLQRRIDRTVAYLRRVLDGPLDPTTRMVAEAAISGPDQRVPVAPGRIGWWHPKCSYRVRVHPLYLRDHA